MNNRNSVYNLWFREWGVSRENMSVIQTKKTQKSVISSNHIVLIRIHGGSGANAGNTGHKAEIYTSPS